MIRPTDETLMAFADDMLAADQHAAVEAYLATDVEASRLVEAFRRSRQQAAAAFGQVMQEPAPERLIETIMRSGRTGAAPSTHGVAFGLRHHRSSGAPAMHPIARALAASLVVVIVGLGGFLAGRETTSTGAGRALTLGVLEPDSKLAILLETRPSGMVRDLGAARVSQSGAQAAQVIATFRDRNGRYCREVEIGNAAAMTATTMAGIACRHPTGVWVMEGAVLLAVASADPSLGYKPSGASVTDALEGVLQQLGAGSALQPDQEAALLSRGWK